MLFRARATKVTLLFFTRGLDCSPSSKFSFFLTDQASEMSDPTTQGASTSSGNGADSNAVLNPEDERKTKALESYRKALKNHEDLSSNVKKRE